MTVVLILTSFFLITSAVWLWSITAAQTASFLVYDTSTSELGLFPKRDWLNTIIAWDLRLLPFFLLAALSGWLEGIGWLSTIGIIVLTLLGVLSTLAVGKAESPLPITSHTGARLVGDLELPKRMYVGDSCPVTLRLNRSYWSDPESSNSIEVYDQREGKLVVLNLRDNKLC